MGRATASGEAGQHQAAEERIADCVASSAKTILLRYISSFRVRALRGMCRLCLRKGVQVSKRSAGGPNGSACRRWRCTPK